MPIYQLVERRKLWFSFSGLLILPGILIMIWQLITTGSPLPLSIDYTGGTLWEVRFEQPVSVTDVRTIFAQAGYGDTTAFAVEDDRTVQLKLKDITPEEKAVLQARMIDAYGPFDERSFRSIGPAIGAEVAQAALLAVAAAAVLILLYIAFAFREVPHPLRYGTAAIVALIHDVLVTVSFMGIMHLVAGWEVDALFLTATLTVIGFSVNDTIVIFDRIRENLRRYKGERLATIANRSIIETAQRSIATQVTALLVLVAILIYGGATLTVFMAVLVVGLVSGTYSSIFTATPIIVGWEEGDLLGKDATPPPSVTSEQMAAA